MTPPTTYVRDAGRVLADVVNAAADTSDLALLLDRLARVTLEAAAADRVSFFLLDEEGAGLRLWAAASHEPDDELWNLGLAMPPISLDEVPARRELFERGLPLGIDDALTSPLVPNEWAEIFELASLVLAPLRHGNETLGLVVVDWKAGRTLPEDLVHLVGTIARSAGTAVASLQLSARLADRAARLKSLLDGTEALSGSRSLGEVTERVAEAYVRVLGARHLSIQLLDGGGTRYRTLVTLGVHLPAEGELRELPRRAVAQVARAWRQQGRARSIVLRDVPSMLRDGPVPDGIRSVLVHPLTTAPGEVFGFVLVGFEDPAEPTAATLELAEALGAQVAFAVDRARLDEQVAMGAEFARALLSDRELGPAHGAELLEGLRAAVRPALGFEVVDVRLVGDRRLSAGGRGSTAELERTLWKRWRRRRTRPALLERGTDVYAPAWAAGRVLGVVHARLLRGHLASHERHQLEALASAIGESVERERMSETVRRRDFQLALAEERAAVGTELDSTVERFLVAVENAAEQLARVVPDAAADKANALAGLARAGAREIRETVASLGLLSYEPGGLEATLSEVVEAHGRRLEAAAGVVVRGTSRPLTLQIEQALIRVAHEVLSRVERDGRATAIAVHLDFRAGEVELSIRDDGIDLPGREGGGGLGAHFGLRLLQRRMETLGGQLQVDRPGPRGLLVRASVPA